MPSRFVVCAGMLWIMDASINVSMEPFRAFVGDNLPENNVPWDLPCKVFFGLALTSHQTTVNFTYEFKYSSLGIIPDSVKYSFFTVELYLLLPFYGR
jgi:maltose/moltooligosaccharide transporter